MRQQTFLRFFHVQKEINKLPRFFKSLKILKTSPVLGCPRGLSGTRNFDVNLISKQDRKTLTVTMIFLHFSNEIALDCTLLTAPGAPAVLEKQCRATHATKFEFLYVPISKSNLKAPLSTSLPLFST